MGKSWRLIAIPLLAAISATAQINTWELGHPDAKLMIGVNLKSLRESPVGQTFRSEMGARTPPMGQAGMALGFLEQIDRIFISSPAVSPPRMRTAAKAGPVENPPFLVVVEGTLPVQQLLAFLPGSTQRYRSVDVFRGAKPTDPSIAMLDTQTVILGDHSSVLAAIDRRGNAAAPATATSTRAKQLASTYDFWVLATDDLSKFQPASANLPAAMASDTKGVDLGFTVRNGLQMEMGITMSSEETAMQLLQLFSKQLALVRAQDPEMANATQKLQMGTQGSQLRASISLSKDEFEQYVRKFRDARVTAGTPFAPPGTASSPRAVQPRTTNPPPPPPGKVRIYGLDEGVREIPLTR